MAARDLYRATRRTGGLDPIINSLRDIWQKQATQKYYSDFLSQYNKAKAEEENLGVNKLPLQNAGNPLVAKVNPGIQRGSESNLPFTLSNQTVYVNNPLNKLGNNQVDPLKGSALNPRTGLPNAQRNALVPRGNQVPIQVQENVVPVTGMQNIQSNFDNPQSLQNYYAAQNIINNFVAQMYSKALEEGVDPNTIDPLAQILQGEAERYKPIPPQFQEFDPKSGERQYNPATNTWDVIRRNKQMTKSTSNASESKKETNDPLGIR